MALEVIGNFLNVNTAFTESMTSNGCIVTFSPQRRLLQKVFIDLDEEDVP